MAEGAVSTGGPRRRGVSPSFLHALPYFLPVAVYALVLTAALLGGWWIAAPLAFFFLADAFDRIFGGEERNMDPATTPRQRLYWYEVALWAGVTLWPVTLAAALWLMLVSGHLAAWETLAMAVVLGNVATVVLVAGHEGIHAPVDWKRKIGEFTLGSVGCAHYAAEHVYVHHARVATAADPMTAPKGQGFWRYLPHAVGGSIVESWRNARGRLVLRQLPVWHYTNPFWRYAAFNLLWFAVAWAMAGAWGLLVFSIQVVFAVVLLRLGDYVEHYGLTRLAIGGGRYERVRSWHSWNATSRFANWLYFNTQRHSDHHGAASRAYPLLQNRDPDEAPRLPGGYARAFNLAMTPKRWFATMDPEVDRWRVRHYPQVTDWSVYQSAALAARPEAFDLIAEIHASAPRLARRVDAAPELLDVFLQREFTDLDLPDGFGPDAEFESIARSGLARLYWIREFGIAEMREQIAEIPVQGMSEAVDAARNWCNEKVLQIAMHTVRGSLSPKEAGLALSRVAEASTVTALAAASDHTRGGTRGNIAAVLVGDLASGEVAPGAALEILFVGDGDPRGRDRLCRRFGVALERLTRDNLLFAPRVGAANARDAGTIADMVEGCRDAAGTDACLRLIRARCVFASGDPDIAERFSQARSELLEDADMRERLARALVQPADHGAAPGPMTIDAMAGGLADIERAARLLQVTTPGIAARQSQTAEAVFRKAYENGLIAETAAESLGEAAATWRSLKVVLGLIADDGFDPASAAQSVQAVVARSCGVDDLAALNPLIRDKATVAVAEIDALSRSWPSWSTDPGR